MSEEPDGHNRGVTLVDIADDGTGHTLSWPLTKYQHRVICQFLELKFGPSPENVLMSPDSIRTITEITQDNMVVLRTDEDDPSC